MVERHGGGAGGPAAFPFQADVQRDTKQPGTQTGLFAERGQGAKSAQKRFLDGVLGVLGVVQRAQAGFVARKQLFERGRVTGARRAEQAAFFRNGIGGIVRAGGWAVGAGPRRGR